MTDKIKVWKCEQCSLPKLCGRFSIFENGLSSYEPKGCNLTTEGDVVPIWKETTDFEIFPKGMALHVFDKEKHIHRGNNPVTGAPERIDPEKEKRYQQLMDELNPPLEKWETANTQTPNCAICRWKVEEIRFIELGKDEHNDELFYMCSAQGLQDADECYNSDNCKALFKVEENENPS